VDDNIVYGYYDKDGNYWGDYKAQLTGNGLVDVIEFYPKHTYIQDNFFYVK
jgi:hypothetical protein